MGNEQQQAKTDMQGLISSIIIRPVYGKGFKIDVYIKDSEQFDVLIDQELSTSVAKFKKQLKKLIDEVVTDHVKAIK